MPESAATSTPNPKATAGASIAWRLGQILLKHADISVGKVSLVALDPAKEHFGSEWPRVAEKVRGIVEGAMRNTFKDGQGFSQIDDLSYIVLHHGDGSGIGELMDDLSKEISKKIMGDKRKTFITSVDLIVSPDAQSRSSSGGQTGKESQDGTTSPNNMERLLSEAAQNEEKFSFDNVKHSFSPMYSMDVLSTSASFCRPLLAGRNGRLRCGYNVLPSNADLSCIAELDALTAEYVADSLASSENGGKAPNLIHIPVHRLTLSSRKYREKYLKICDGLLFHWKDDVIFDIYGIEDGTPPTRTAEYVQCLRPHAKAVAATVSIDFLTMASFAGSGVFSIGTDLASVPSENIEQKITRFVARVKSVNTRCHVHGSSKPVADFCLRLAVDTVDGDASAEV